MRFSSSFFHDLNSSGTLFNRLKHFRIWFCLRQDTFMIIKLANSDSAVGMIYHGVKNFGLVNPPFYTLNLLIHGGCVHP